jgi:hypothetical protein
MPALVVDDHNRKVSAAGIVSNDNAAPDAAVLTPCEADLGPAVLSFTFITNDASRELGRAFGEIAADLWLAQAAARG